ARTGKKDQANKTIKEAERTIAPDQAELALAQCHEAVGETTKARMLYEKARAQKPEDAVVLRGLVNFLVRTGELKEAEPLLDTLSRLKGQTTEQAAWARPTLSRVLALQGDYQRSRRALAMLGVGDTDPIGATDRMSTEELRARALVLAVARGRANRLRAIRLLEEMGGRQAPEDRFLLAQV